MNNLMEIIPPTFTQYINFWTVALVNKRYKASLLKKATAVKSMYDTRDFVIPSTYTDQRFEYIQEAMIHVDIKIIDANDYVSIVKSSILNLNE